MRLHIWISGKVIGVWFRESMRTEAERLGINGWTRNLPDGRVEALFDGPEDKVDELVEWCRKGPEAAQVTNIEEKEEREDVPAMPAGFKVLRG